MDRRERKALDDFLAKSDDAGSDENLSDYTVLSDVLSQAGWRKQVIDWEPTAPSVNAQLPHRIEWWNRGAALCIVYVDGGLGELFVPVKDAKAVEDFIYGQYEPPTDEQLDAEENPPGGWTREEMSEVEGEVGTEHLYRPHDD